MAGALITEVIHDGNDVAITGGVRQWDTSGTGVGPNIPVAVIHGVYRVTPATIANGAAGDVLLTSAGRVEVVAQAGAAQYVDNTEWIPGASEGVATLGSSDVTDISRTPSGAGLAAFSLDPNANARVVLPSLRSFADLGSSFNRPANTTAYAANDAVNDNATAGGGSSSLLSWTIPKGKFTITRVRVRKSDQTVATPTIRVWFYSSTITMAAGDNEALVHPIATCLGFVDVLVTTAGSDDAAGWASCSIGVTAATLKGQLQTLTAFTPASGETFTVSIEGYPG